MNSTQFSVNNLEFIGCMMDYIKKLLRGHQQSTNFVLPWCIIRQHRGTVWGIGFVFRGRKFGTFIFQYHWSRGRLYPCARSRRWSIESSGNWERNWEATSKAIRIRWSWSPISRRKLNSFVNTSHPTNPLRAILLLLSMPSPLLNPTPTIGIESYIIFIQIASEFISNLLHSYKSW